MRYSVKDHFREWKYYMSKESGSTSRGWYIFFMVVFILAPVIGIPYSIVAWVSGAAGAMGMLGKFAFLLALALDAIIFLITKPR